MKVLIEFVKDLYSYSKHKFITNIIFMTLASITNGIGVVMLVPLLSLTGITEKNSLNIPGLDYILLFVKTDSNTAQLLIVLSVYVMLIIIQTIISRKSAILNTEIIQGYMKHLRVSLYENTIKAEWTCFMDKKRSDITNAFTVEINRIAAGAIYLLKIISQLILALVQIYIAFLMSGVLTIFVLICGVIIFVLMNATLKESKKLGASLQSINKELLSEITDQLNGIKEIKSYGIEKRQLEVFEQVSAKVESNMIDFVKIQSKPDVYYKISAAVVISIFFYYSIDCLNINPSSMLIIILIFARLWPVFSSFQNNLQNIFVMMPSFVSLNKLEEEFKGRSENLALQDGIYNSSKIEVNYGVEFKEVSFSYKDNHEAFQLRNLNFFIPAKKITALVGKSGAGKSTIVDLLLGLIKPKAGYISVDNKAIDEALMIKLRDTIGYVPQEAFLINATIKENLLRFNPNATEEKIYEALNLAAAKEFVDKLPEGIETFIGDRGVKLSGGERQRIVLARALLREPQILVLDEATSALDNENEYKIQRAVEELRGKLTVVVIAHRLSTIKNADNILVVEAGKIVEKGSYDQLKDKEYGVFKKLLEINNKDKL